jgi:hypothetical protein
MHAFNTFFLIITVNLKLHEVGRDDATSFLKRHIPFPGIKITPTTETPIKRIIYSLKSKNSSDYDGITKF